MYRKLFHFYFWVRFAAFFSKSQSSWAVKFLLKNPDGPGRWLTNRRKPLFGLRGLFLQSFSREKVRNSWFFATKMFTILAYSHVRTPPKNHKKHRRGSGSPVSLSSHREDSLREVATHELSKFLVTENAGRFYFSVYLNTVG